MALGNTYLTINGNALHETSSFSISPQVVEKLFQTEDGHDKGILIRASKLKMSVGWENAPDTFKTLCEGFCSSATVTVVFNGNTYTMRARNLKEDLVRYSNRYSGSFSTNGIWNISFDLEEI